MSYYVKLRRNGRIYGKLGPFTTRALAVRQAQPLADHAAADVTVTVEKAKARRRNGLTRVPKAWTDLVTKQYKTGKGKTFNLPLSAFPYSNAKLDAGLAKVWPGGVVPLRLNVWKGGNRLMLAVPVDREMIKGVPGVRIIVERDLTPSRARAAIRQVLREAVRYIGDAALAGVTAWDMRLVKRVRRFGRPSPAVARDLRARRRRDKAGFGGAVPPSHFYRQIGKAADYIVGKYLPPDPTDAEINDAIRKFLRKGARRKPSVWAPAADSIPYWFRKMTKGSSRRVALAQLYAEVARLSRGEN
jgi:hypothetical protein